MKVEKDKRFDGVYWVKNGKRRLATKNLVKGYSVYGEFLFNINNEEYREWIPKRSKLAAYILKGASEMPIKEGDCVLYLGAASGTTASHISDIVGSNGKIYCVDVSPRIVRELVFVCSKKKNMFPILADASKPESYVGIVPKCDIVYQDIAQPNQAEILIKNCEMFLKKNGYALFAVKSRSIDVTANPSKIFGEVEKILSEKFKILDKRRLDPFENDHMMFLLRWKK
ncbi:MAG: fibrillarin-like rRNA/tRNA 2'-O-methyltransferase [Candidatus Parvarchaeota archaeon]|nr:fibrillarin-like rRNA/tRNA 2'-O-methyltransferase [Candidatus Jingweiarchaeum tengchongense]MCW1297930.1 fibrillarin-like rRNA/tRNA 2'-O-methyltransferase [Candidatus Jingweiarchaeum tengchongense]MCW1300649.1 fibrillarin-like rRNA/tRNA 2'-O-methyltransferase [Candidatus Jingweiarchaeum tengchongense]MCW1304632.1 fibrillarin-like rRNA/tRNA 2'-O-methyltransferase [Candidatus Jingweiarchaeum tengchongense]MCW1305649.1 fibrillarin-like rRNA/tRNA 2'-O-methyltransferase [Candidatus Jingweiarchaeu